jgi:hypothetical protein
MSVEVKAYPVDKSGCIALKCRHCEETYYVDAMEFSQNVKYGVVSVCPHCKERTTFEIDR